MISSFDGKRLKEARLFNSMSITYLATKLDVTKQMISKYENNKAEPSLEKSFILFKELGFPREFFYTSENFNYLSTGTFFRSRITATKKSKQPAEFLLKYALLIRNFLEEYIEFPDLVNLNDLDNLDDIENIAQKLREIINIYENPIEDMVELLEILGFIVVKFSYEEEKIDAFSCSAILNEKNYFAIVTGNPTSFFRQQFSLAHELGHFILHKDYNPEELEKEEYKLMEEEANKFAAAFLLPKETFGKELKTINVNLSSILKLKNKWKVSISAIIERGYQLKIIENDKRKNLYRQLNYHNWKKIEPLDEETPISEPLATSQAIELLIDEKIFTGVELRKSIEKRFNLYISKSMMAKVSNVDESIFTPTNSINLNLKMKYFGEINNK